MAGWIWTHRHWWRKVSVTKDAIVEDCSCGLVRTIEIKAGKAPVVREAICAVPVPNDE